MRRQADYQRIAELEYELGFTDVEPPPRFGPGAVISYRGVEPPVFFDNRFVAEKNIAWVTGSLEPLGP